VSDPLKKVVDFIRNPDFFGGKLAGAGKDFIFTPGEGALKLPSSVISAVSYWSGLQISFNYVVNVGDVLSVFPIGGPIHWIDPSGLKGQKLPGSYFDYLNGNHPGKVKRPEFDKPGKGIPDIMTTRANKKQFYEIKPDNAGGQRDGKDKLDRINTTLDRFFAKGFYQPGQQQDILPLSLKCVDVSCGAGNCEVFVEQRLQPVGLILYKFRLRFEIDPGPFISKAVIALAIVALIEGGAALMSRAAGAAVERGVVDAVEEVGVKKIRVELLKRIAEHAGKEVVGEQIGELGTESIVEEVAKKAVQVLTIPSP
jgi:hypothetical protein